MNNIEASSKDSIDSSLESVKSNPRLIAFYLPQFYPFPENDKWWGKGFTEWTNVTKAKPLYYNHRQPHLPSDFGFYDLRVSDTRRDQIATAKSYGIDGFCYHYYWFSGKRLLDVPLDDMLNDPESDMPFCLCWANENWTRTWDANEKSILIAQEYNPDDDINFIKSLIPYFTDNRYIRFDGKPFLIVYRPQQIPDPVRSASIWRDYCQKIGVGEIHICAALTHGNTSYEEFGFDSGVEFPPHNVDCRNMQEQLYFAHSFKGSVYDYREVAAYYLNTAYGDQKIHNTVVPGWDNTARNSNRGLIMHDSSPAAYQSWLSQTIKKTMSINPKQEKLVFINAWNEWAEGCHLEPDQEFGKAYLEATLKAKSGEPGDVDLLNHSIGRSHLPKKRRMWNEIAGVLVFHTAEVKRKGRARLVKIESLRKFVKWLRKVMN